MLDLESAIKHCEEVAEKYDTELNLINCGISNESCDNCIECASEHRQLAEWLRELQWRRQAMAEIREAMLMPLDMAKKVYKEVKEVNAECR